jgi:hypothetical protein
MFYRVYVHATPRCDMLCDLPENEKPLPPGKVVALDRRAELTQHQSALSKYIQLLRAAKAART